MITKEDIKAMKSANTVVFRTTGNNAISGKSMIECQKNPATNNTWNDGNTLYRQIDVTATNHIYRSNGKQFDSASECLLYAYDNPEWQSIVSLVRPGDSLHLVWIGGNNNQYLDEAELRHDQLKIQIFRPIKNGGNRVMTFMLDSSICPDNSARMIKLV